MEITLSVLADAANRADSGKLNLLGVFHNIYAPSMPCQHPMMALVLSFEASPMERGTQANIEIHLIDEDGRAVFSLPESLLDIPSDPSTLTPTMNLIINMGGILFERYGTYRFDVRVNGESRGRIPLQVQPPEVAKS